MLLDTGGGDTTAAFAAAKSKLEQTYTTATVLHSNGVTNISAAADAARALEPLVQTYPNAGTLAKVIFAAGVLGMGLLGVPVLAGSASYAVAEAMDWEEGLNRKPSQARAFYAVLVGSMVLGLGMTLIGFDPIKLLIFAAVINGVVSVPFGGSDGPIAWEAHVGGFLAGFFLFPLFDPVPKEANQAPE